MTHDVVRYVIASLASSIWWIQQREGHMCVGNHGEFEIQPSVLPNLDSSTAEFDQTGGSSHRNKRPLLDCDIVSLA